jgi:hypothetical protein
MARRRRPQQVEAKPGAWGHEKTLLLRACDDRSEWRFRSRFLVRKDGWLWVVLLPRRAKEECMGRPTPTMRATKHSRPAAEGRRLGWQERAVQDRWQQEARHPAYQRVCGATSDMIPGHISLRRLAGTWVSWGSEASISCGCCVVAATAAAIAQSKSKQSQYWQV